VLLCSFTNLSYSQSSDKQIKKYLTDHKSALELSSTDIEDWIIYDEYTSEEQGITYKYLRQRHEGVEVYNAVATFAVKDGNLIMTGNNLQRGINDRVNAVTPILSTKDAISSAAAHLKLDVSAPIEFVETRKDGVQVFSSEELSNEVIPVKLMLFPTESGDIRLVWDLSLDLVNESNWWSVRIDALTGEFLDNVNWTLHCDFGCKDHSTEQHKSYVANEQVISNFVSAPAPPPGTDQYNVFPIPIESPNHGPRSLVVGPYHPLASPFGWHDTDGTAGAEFTITRGNNVFATEDQNGNNGTGYAPTGGASLDFDFPLNLNQAPALYEDAAITNLFYMNNIMHDVWYRYGFDESSGNFQENNYGNGGAGSDYVNADAQDGSGMNNANFSTPADGSNPRMQMYLWDPGVPNLLTVNTPAGIAGSYAAEEAGFGSPVPVTPITSNLVLFDDNSGVDPNDACETAVNAAAMNGNIVVIMRGDCEFGFKVLAAENAGATAVIMINNVAGGTIAMGPGASGGSVTIPSVMISNTDGALLLAEMSSGTVNATLVSAGGSFDLDGDFDNGVVAHEYGHGISIRLTGGPSNSNCLSNDEQMGEGWSDWFGLMLTIESGDQSDDIRGIGTYASGEAPSGFGIRPAPYTTDLAINNFTYDATNNTGAISQPHGIGFVWCTMLWDMTWALIDEYGFDADVYDGSGGNNIAMNLVMQGLKLQPCNPGFVDGRDAILQADQLLYGGVNQCLIWNAFAARGLGYSASQGSSNSRTDQTEAFDLPPGFVNSSGSESVSACGSYTWPATGQTYTSNGSYIATLANAAGCDSTATLNLTINNLSTGSETIATCSSYTWPTSGNTYTSSGAYTAVLTNAVGCDSIVTLNLTINNDYVVNEVVTSCASYYWPANGVTYTSTGNYTTTLTAVTGCDSTINLDLTMSTSAATNETVSACNSYNWAANGNTYTSTGTYSVTLTSTTGCDSIVTLYLTVNSPNAGSESVTACDSYTWAGNGQTYTSGGAYTATLTNAAGCDSLATLNLTINTSDSNPPEVVSACGSYVWAADGNTYASSGTYNAFLTNAAGCDSNLVLDLTITSGTTTTEDVTACGSYTWPADGITYSTSGAYMTTLTNGAGCDSTITLNLTINTVSTSINYIDVVTLSVGASGGTYQWLDCNNNYSVIPGETGQTFAPSVNGSYACEITLNGCTDTTACRSVSTIGIEENDFGTSLKVYPNPTFGQLTVDLGEDYEIISARLMNVSGQLVEEKVFNNANAFEMNIIGGPGFYILEISTSNDMRARIRVLKE
jgi:hypothetical protein